MQGNFEACLTAFWTFDGARVDAAPGEHFATSYGVTKMSWDDAVNEGLVSGDMNNAPVADFAKILEANYWDRNNCNQLPIGIDLMVFNDGTLSGYDHAAKLLQRLVGTEVDGQIGPLTLKAVGAFIAASSIEALIDRIAGADKIYLLQLNNAPLYINGWMRRERYMQTTAYNMVATYLDSGKPRI